MYAPMTEFITDTPISPSFDDELYQPSSQGLDVAEPKVEVIPAIEVALTGRHLIEASAGTGKTWTLTGIVLRLLIEARRAPEQIIATTFTRAAAAEMRQRIHDRLVDFYRSDGRQRELVEPIDDADEFSNAVQREPQALAINAELAQRLKELIGDLPPPQREAFLLKVEAGLSLQEIANVTGSDKETVKSRLRYAVKKLRNQLRLDDG